MCVIGYICVKCVNTLRPGDTIVRQRTGWPLFIVMPCRMYGTKPLPEAMMTYYQMKPKEHISVKLLPKYKHFELRSCVSSLKCVQQQGILVSWWRHQMETFAALLAILPVPVEFPTQRPVTRSFDVFFDLRLNKRLSKQSWGWWLETLSCSLWRHCNGYVIWLASSL